MTHRITRSAMTLVALVGPMIVTAPARGGGRPAVGPSPDPAARLGSWGYSVKDGATWETNDAASTVEALLATRQNFFMHPVSTDNEWADFQLLLEAAEGTELEIYAVMPAPNLSHAGCRWFDTDGDGATGDVPPDRDCGDLGYGQDRWDCDRVYIGHWINAWEAAATAVAALSVDFPNLVGFNINDFMLFVESADFPVCLDGDRLTKEEIRRIYDACHSTGTPFGFYPAIQHPSFPRFISPGYILGTNYAVRMRDDEWMSVQFDVALLPRPQRARLTFFHTAESGDEAMIRSVRVNDAEVWASPLDDDGLPIVEYAAHEVDLHAGHNLVELRLDASPTGELTSGCGGSGDWWRLWDVELVYWVPTPGGPPRRVVFPLVPRFEIGTNALTYQPQGTCESQWFDLFDEIQNDQCRCHVGGSCAPFLPDDPHLGRLARRLVSAPNAAYLIHDVIDGVVPYLASTDPRGPSDALDPNLHYRDLLRTARRDLRGDTLIPMQTALRSQNDLGAEVIAHRVAIASAVARRAGVFRFPLSLYFADPSDRRGIFAESPVLGGSVRYGSSSGLEAQLMAQYPSRLGPMPGWYQRWTHDPAGGGDVDLRVEVWDSRAASASHEDTLLKWVDGDGLASAYEADPYADDTESVYVPLDGTLMRSTSSDRVMVGFETTSGPTVNTRAYFRAVDADGVDVPPADWIFESGVDDPRTLEVYGRLIELFRLIRGP